MTTNNTPLTTVVRARQTLASNSEFGANLFVFASDLVNQFTKPKSFFSSRSWVLYGSPLEIAPSKHRLPTPYKCKLIHWLPQQHFVFPSTKNRSCLLSASQKLRINLYHWIHTPPPPLVNTPWINLPKWIAPSMSVFLVSLYSTLIYRES